MKYSDIAPISVSTRVAGQGKAYLLTVFAHIGEDLRESTHRVELIHVHPRLLGQVCIHVLVTYRRHLSNV